MEQTAAGATGQSCAQDRVLQAKMVAAAVMGVPLDALCSNTRGNPMAAFARQAAMYLCRVVFRMTLADVARGFGRKSDTVVHAVRLIEEARRDPELDRTLHWLETSLREAAHG